MCSPTLNVDCAPIKHQYTSSYRWGSAYKSDMRGITGVMYVEWMVTVTGLLQGWCMWSGWLQLQVWLCMVFTKAVSNTQVGVVTASGAERSGEMPLTTCPPYTTYAAITASCSCVRVVTASESLQCLVLSLWCVVSSPWTLLFTKCQNQFSSELFVSEFSSGVCVSTVHYVGDDHNHFNHPKENLPPPTHRFPDKLIIWHTLVKAVNSQHIFVVLIDHLWLGLWWSARKPVQWIGNRYVIALLL